MVLADDGAFAAFSKKIEADKAAKANKKTFNGTPKEYDEIKWKGLEKGETTIVRLVGNPPASMTPGFKGDDYTAKEIYFSKVKNDDGKIIQLKLPPHAEDAKDEHPIHKLINEVKAVDWIPDPNQAGKKMKVYKYQNYPWFDKVVHGGYDPKNEEFAYKSSKGWAGQEVVIMNVIDREDNWCAENKHTKLLSKRVGESVDKDGNVQLWPDVGVPCYGFLDELSILIGKYGNWEKYDIAIEKTGVMTQPYKVKNASALSTPAVIEAGVCEIASDKLGFVSQNKALTPEEQAYERYNLAKMYAPTTITKFFNAFEKTLKAIDGDLGTTYYDDFKKMSEDEIAEWEAQKGAPVADPTPDTLNEATFVANGEAATAESNAEEAEAPVVKPSRVVQMGLAANKIAALKGWSMLSPKEQGIIKDVILDENGEAISAVYDKDAMDTWAGQEVDCNPGGCGKLCPEKFRACPFCGVEYGTSEA